MTISVMRVQDALKLPSIDSRGNDLPPDAFWGEYKEDPYDPKASVATTIERKPVDGRYYDELREAIKKVGINRVPVHVNDGQTISDVYGGDLPEKWRKEPQVMGNGHHRIKILKELGFQYVLTTTEKNQSGYRGEYTSEATDKLFQPTKYEGSIMPVIKSQGHFAVEVNNGTGDGWEIAQGPIPRAYARRLKKWYENHVDRSKQPNFHARVVPTGEYKMVDA